MSINLITELEKKDSIVARKTSTKARERDTVETTIQGSTKRKRTVVPAGAGDERSAERFREEKSPTLLAGRRHIFLSLFFLCCRFGKEKRIFELCNRNPKPVTFCSIWTLSSSSKNLELATDARFDDDALAPFLHLFLFLFFFSPSALVPLLLVLRSFFVFFFIRWSRESSALFVSNLEALGW